MAVNQKLREEEGEDLDKVAKDVDLQEEALRVHRLKLLGPSASSIYHIIYHIYTISEQLVHFLHLLGSITVNFTLSRQDYELNRYLILALDLEKVITAYFGLGPFQEFS